MAEKETMGINYEKDGKKIKAEIDISNMTSKEMFEEIKKLTGKE